MPCRSSRAVSRPTIMLTAWRAPSVSPADSVAIGKLISALEKLLRRLFPATRNGERLAGGILWVLVVSVSAGIPALLLWLCRSISPWLGLAAESVMCWTQLPGTGYVQAGDIRICEVKFLYQPVHLCYRLQRNGSQHQTSVRVFLQVYLFTLQRRRGAV